MSIIRGSGLFSPMVNSINFDYNWFMVNGTWDSVGFSEWYHELQANPNIEASKMKSQVEEFIREESKVGGLLNYF